MNRLTRLLPIVGGAVAGGVIALAIASGSTNTRSVTTTVIQQSSGTALPTSLSSSRGLTVHQIYRQASPGVVDIVVTQNNPSPFGGTTPSAGEGAGVVYDRNGDILTDEHVVSGASSVTVHFADGRSASAKVLGTDPSTDVAVIHVNVPASELHPIPVGDSSAAAVGDPVVAIGSPFSLPETTTAGIVSAVGRSIQAPNGYTITGSIQTDAAINPGNSGGPLLDANAQVIGLNDQIQTNSGSSAGVGFAIPSNTLVHIAGQIIGGRPVRHAYVGVSLDPTSTGGARISLHADQNGNAPVRSGSPAAKAGLQPGDLITAINGKAIASTQQFIETIDTYSPGDKLTVTVQRAGKALKFTVTLGARSQAAPAG
ncbi:MAG: trypsin-like peptidase domain-containing protein [Actinomycetota bacterium]|nr:trypsin-like peptidase domain-containing protein [Actinomycetota bacterium]